MVVSLLRYKEEGHPMDNDDYEVHCKYCEAKPYSPGPQHETTCRRWRISLDLHCAEANEYKCKHCGVTPFVEGSHHEDDCPRKTVRYHKTLADVAPPWMHNPKDPDYHLNRGTTYLIPLGGEHPLFWAKPKWPRLGGEHPLDNRFG